MALIKVRNRNNGTTGYKLADGNVRRQFRPGETKQIDENEIRQLMFEPGGRELLENYLIIQDQGIISELLGSVEPEYNYTEEDIKKLLETGSEDQLRDCLDFAPDGVKELIRQMAVDLRLNDMRKRKIISDYFNFDINGAIQFKEEDEEEQNKDNPTTERRADPITPSTPVRQQRRVVVKKSTE